MEYEIKHQVAHICFMVIKKSDRHKVAHHAKVNGVKFISEASGEKIFIYIKNSFEFRSANVNLFRSEIGGWINFFEALKRNEIEFIYEIYEQTIKGLNSLKEYSPHEKEKV